MGSALLGTMLGGGVAPPVACVSPPALAAQFVAADDTMLSAASNASLQTGDIDFTVAGWIYNETAANGAHQITKGQSLSGHEYTMFVSGTNYLVRFKSGTGVLPIPGLLTGVWQFVVFYHDSVGDEIGGSVNDAALTTVAYAGGVTANADPFKLGDGTTNLPHDGRMQCVGFWKSVLSAANITALYNGGEPLAYCALPSGLIVPASMISYWNQGEESAGVAPVQRDDSHGTNHLADTNTVASIARGAA